MSNKAKSAIWEWVESIVIAFILAMVIRTFIVQAFKIPTGSMRPTLLEGDRILVNKFIYGARIPFTDIRLPALGQPRRGDIIVFRSPEDGKKDFVKRLIATEGETVEIRDGKIYIDNKVVEEPVSIKGVYYHNNGDYGSRSQVIKVPKDSYYALGDNSSSSRDSRYWGFVPKSNLIGKVIVIYWPIHRMKTIK